MSGSFGLLPLSRVICDISSELFSFVAAGILTPVTCDIPFPGNTVNRCALNLTKICTALAQNPFFVAKTVVLYAKCRKNLHSGGARSSFRFWLLTLCCLIIGLCITDIWVQRYYFCTWPVMTWYAKPMSIRIISICSVRHFLMLNPQKKHGGEHPNVYYMLCVAHLDARRFFKHIMLLTISY